MKGFKFPSAFTIIALLIVIVAVLTWLIPAGRYQLDEDGRPIPGSYERLDQNGQGPLEVFLAPVDGMYGIKNAEGFIGTYESGTLFGAIAVALFVLVIGGFITMTMKTGAITAGIRALTTRFGARARLLIPVLMVLFAAGGTTYGMAEETLGFYVVIIALFISLGYDAMTGAALILLGAGVGVLGSTLNPFATGIASDSAGITIDEGMPLRLAMLVVLTTITIIYVMLYARRVRANAASSVVAAQADEHRRYFGKLAGDDDEVPPLDRRRGVILVIFFGTFLFMIFSVIPWSELGVTFLPTLGWYFAELSALFIFAAILVGLIAGYGEGTIVDTFIEGARDFVSVALIIGLARGVTVIMSNGYMTDTILNAFEDLLAGTSAGVFAVLLYIVNIPIAFLVPSSSGQAALVMPIFAPLADFAGVERSIAVTAYQSASGIVNLVTPTSAVVMGGLVLARVGYDRFLRFVGPLLLILFVVTCIFMFVGASFGGGA